MRFSHVSIFCAYLCLKTSATCYYPNGTADSTGQQAPCNTSGHSMCCLLANVTASNADTCRSDGLCVPFDNSVLYRDLCTDPTWKDPACLDLCLTGLDNYGANYSSIEAPLTTCADGSLCCGALNSDNELTCCSAREGKSIVNGKVVSGLPSSTSAATTATPAHTSSPPSSSSATSAPKSASSNDTGAIVGGVVGGVAAVVFLALAFWYLMIRRSLHQRDQQQPQMERFEHKDMGEQHVWRGPSEMPGLTREPRMGELDAGQLRQSELDGR